MVITNGELIYEVLATNNDKAIIKCNDTQLLVDQMELVTGVIYEPDSWGCIVVPKEAFSEYLVIEFCQFTD